jgi:hypothetical protein
MRTDNQNMVLILSRFQLNQCARDGQRLDKISWTDAQPHLTVAIQCADVVIIKDGTKFAVLKHRHMLGVTGQEYHISTLNNIMFAR